MQSPQQLKIPTVPSPTSIVAQTSVPVFNTPVPKVNENVNMKYLRAKAKLYGFSRYWKISKDVLKGHLETYESTNVIPVSVRRKSRIGQTCAVDEECYSKICRDQTCKSVKKPQTLNTRPVSKPQGVVLNPNVMHSKPKTKKQNKKAPPQSFDTKPLEVCISTCIQQHIPKPKPFKLSKK